MRHLHRTLSFGILALTIAACASARQPIRDTRAQILAHELKVAAERAHDSARREGRHDRRESRAVRALAEMEQRARHFHRQLEGTHRQPDHARADFVALADAYRDAARWVDDLDRREPKRAFRRVGELLHELYEIYDYREDRRDYRDDHGRDRDEQDCDDRRGDRDDHDRHDRHEQRYVQYHYDR